MGECVDFFVGNVPSCTENTHAWVVLILNILIAGLGTLLAGTVFSQTVDSRIMLWALLQFVCLIIFVGWVWSIWWGVVYFRNRNNQPPKLQEANIEEKQQLHQQ